MDAIISGIAIDLPGALDDDALQMITDAVTLADTASSSSHGSGVGEA